jgi:hypothetical protein
VAILGAVVVLLVGLLLVAGRIDGAQDGGPAGVRRFAETQRRAFLTAAPTRDDGLARLGSTGGSRSDLYRVAWSAFRAAPLAGQGVGDYPQRWLRERRTPQPVQNAHSLPLDVLAGTGIVGLLLLGVALAATGTGAVLSRVRPALLSRTLAAGASAGVATFLASCALDWTWQIATLTTTAILLAAPLLVDGRVRREAGSRRVGARGRGAPEEGWPASSPMGRAQHDTITADTP